MMKWGAILGLCLSSSLAFGQIDSNSVTVTASRSANLQPDEVLFLVSVSSSSTGTTLSDVIAVLQGTGITQASLTGVNVHQSTLPVNRLPVIDPTTGTTTVTTTRQSALEWGFSLAVPLTKLKDTVAMLAALQQSVLQKNNGLTLSFYLQTLQVSAKLAQTASCASSDLLSDARAKAQKLADAAGFSVGNVLAISSTISTEPAGSVSIYQSSSYQPSGCSLTGKFALGRF